MQVSGKLAAAIVMLHLYVVPLLKHSSVHENSVERTFVCFNISSPYVAHVCNYELASQLAANVDL